MKLKVLLRHQLSRAIYSTPTTAFKITYERDSNVGPGDLAESILLVGQGVQTSLQLLLYTYKTSFQRFNEVK